MPDRRTFTAAALSAALAPRLARAAPADALAALADRYHEGQARFDPLYSATLTGDDRFDGALPLTIAPAARRARFAFYRRVLRELATIPRARLGDDDALTHDLLGAVVAGRLAFEPYPDHLLPLQQMDSVPVLLANFASGQAEQPLRTAAQHAAYLSRLSLLPAWCRQAVANMRDGIARGVVLPRPVAASTLAVLRPLATPRLGANPYGAAAELVPADDRGRLAERYRETVEQQVAPALRQLADFIERDYLPACRDSAGWSALPDGAAWYRQWVRDQTTSALAPAAIHALGVAEVARIRSELAAVAPRLGYAGDPANLLAWVRDEPRFQPYTSEAQILDAYRALNARIEAALPRLFGRRPRAALEVRPEPELTKAVASDHYALPADDGSRPGVFWAVVNDPKRYDATTMTALLLHEGQPGHHFQMALQQEMRALPQFRKRLWINAYGEGWALYAETLGREIGLYDDPAAWVGELRLEIARAARLVVDTGLHDRGWSRERAITYWMDVVGASEAQAKNQIERYMAWPGQALGYKVGALEIQDLRRSAEGRLGSRFDIAAFHDTVLGDGALTLPLLRARVGRWVRRA